MKDRPIRKLRFLKLRFLRDGSGYELQSFVGGQWRTPVRYKRMTEAERDKEAKRLQARGFVVVEK